MSFCDAWPASPSSFGPFSSLASPSRSSMIGGRVGPDGVDATPDVHHDGDVVLDEFHRGHHLADALTGQILEIAGLEDRNDALADFLAQDLLLVRRIHLAQRAGGLIDRLGGFQDLLGRFLGAADHGAELAGDLGHFIAVEALAVQHRDFTLGAVDGIVNQIELDLELFALLDLGAIGLQQRLRTRRSAALAGSAAAPAAAPWPGAAIWARMARSSFMISRCIGPTSPSTAAGIGMSPTKACSIRKRLRLTGMGFFLTSLVTF